MFLGDFVHTPIILAINDEPTYGTFWMECIGIVDYLAMIKTEDTEDFNGWFDKFHPRKYFSNCTVELDLHNHLDSSGKDQQRGRMAIFAPTIASNTKWDFHGCEYGQTVGGRKRPMPLIQSEKKILRWQQGMFLKNTVLVPEWLLKCSTIDDLIEMDRSINLPCQYCPSITQ